MGNIGERWDWEGWMRGVWWFSFVYVEFEMFVEWNIFSFIGLEKDIIRWDWVMKERFFGGREIWVEVGSWGIWVGEKGK